MQAITTHRILKQEILKLGYHVDHVYPDGWTRFHKLGTNAKHRYVFLSGSSRGALRTGETKIFEFSEKNELLKRKILTDFFNKAKMKEEKEQK